MWRSLFKAAFAGLKPCDSYDSPCATAKRTQALSRQDEMWRTALAVRVRVTACNLPCPGPGRLPNVSYVGIQRYFLTLCTSERRDWFKNADVVDHLRSQLLPSAVDHQFSTPAYCFMPDHLHLMAEGASNTSDLQRFVSAFKQKTGFWFSGTHDAHLWQDGYHDRILRNDEETLKVVRYILDNPVRAGLVRTFTDYQFSGSDRYSLADLGEAVSQG